jgi:hypothetical protein
LSIFTTVVDRFSAGTDDSRGGGAGAKPAPGGTAASVGRGTHAALRAREACGRSVGPFASAMGAT